jgi:uncharacterized membrane protein
VSTESNRTFVLIAYVLHLLGAVAGVPSLIGLVLNYVKRNDSGPLLDTHHRWMIRSFWWAILWVVIGVLTWFIVLGWVILGLVWIWYIYRHVRGLIRFAHDQPMPV